MKTRILKDYWMFFLSGLLFLSSYKTFSQNPRATFNNINGSNLYKQSKLYDSKKGAVGGKPKAVGDKASQRIKHELELLKDPSTGRIPHDIKTKEKAFSKKLPIGSFLKKNFNKKGTSSNTNGVITGNWNTRGPENVGGRTRALAIDLTDENIIFAGGVSGGVWRSTDTGASWNRVTAADQNPSVTAIVQDPRLGFNNIWYYVSGEHLGNSANATTGAAYQGTGIYKSIDNGLTWSRIIESNDLEVTSIAPLDYISNVAVNPLNGDVYFSASSGILRIKPVFPTVLELVLDANLSFMTDVKISPTGKIYATVSKEDGVDGSGVNININAGILVSDDGNIWNNITPPTLLDGSVAFGRAIIDIDPSNENNVWFFADNLIPNTNEYLWKYQVDTNTWSDRSAGIPTNLGDVGKMETQQGYNMLLKVHPNNSDIVFLGGTNLYRSNNGFTNNPGKAGWIGGYNTTSGYAQYANHHPDQHNLLFFPSNPSKALSANDGGVQITQDILQGATIWTSLNNGYLTTQPYAVSFNPNGNDNALLAGFQDTGSWYTSSNNLQDPWTSKFNGDGSYNAIADNLATLYVSSQNGNAYRFHYDENTDTNSFARITPDITTGGFDYITPFILDHNNDNIMYMPSGGSMLVNTNLDEIPTGSNEPTNVNWFRVNGNALGSSITAMDVSTYPVQHKLYFGANLGGFFRVDNAHLPGATRSGNLAGGKGMGPGRINCVYVDPTNSDRVFVVKSNYNVKSIWKSEDSGETWSNISGNLEENEDGSGNGPSVRWITMIGNNDGYLVGTSTGMYTTDLLDGLNTIWTREVMNIESETIENVVVSQVKSRNDGFTVAATHGNGIFSANFSVTARPKPTLSSVNIEQLQLSNDIGSYNLDISDNFISSTNSPINIIVASNSKPDLCTVNIEGNELQFTNIDVTKEGEIKLVLEASSGVEKTTLIVNVEIRGVTVYEQDTEWVFSTPSNYDYNLDRLASCADDFIIPEGFAWTLNRVFALGSSFGEYANLVDNATVEIFDDNNGKPGNMVYTTGTVSDLNNLASEDYQSLDLNIPFPTEVELQPGKYWLVVYARLAFLPYSYSWMWANTDVVIGYEAQFKNPKGFIYNSTTDPDNPKLIASDWTNESTVFGGAPLDHLFYIYGSNKTLGVEEIDIDNLTVFPNPSRGMFTIKFMTALSNDIKISVYDIQGRNIYTNNYKTTGNFNQNINLNNVQAGLYLLEVNDGFRKTTKKIIIK